MRVRLIDDDELPVPVAIGDSVLWVRRLPESERRAVAAKRRREMQEMQAQAPPGGRR
jgi:hypothetical protein